MCWSTSILFALGLGWGLTLHAQVAPSPRHVNTAEYFWDTDPGPGNGVPLLAVDGALDETVEALFRNGLSVPAAGGAHRFGVRAQDVDGHWSEVHSTIVHVGPDSPVLPPQRNLVLAEYFWDVDPGQGNGSPLLALDGHLDETVDAVMASGVAAPASAGPHSFNVRVKDFDNTWSSLFTTVVNVEAPPADQRAVAAEYFWDSDPGEGNGTPMVAADGNFDEVLEALLASGISTPASAGPHLFHVRVQGIDGGWSAPFATVVELVANPAIVPRSMHLVQSEYFWDVDPGQGNGAFLPTIDGTPDETLETLFDAGVVTPVGPGPHLLHVRSRDVDGTWSLNFVTVIHPPTSVGGPPMRQLAQAEYFWDADPGAGNGIPLGAADAGIDEILETLFRNSLPTPGNFGPHSFNVRAKGIAGTWSSVFTTVVRLTIGKGGFGYVYGDDNDGDTLDNLFELFLGTNPDQLTEVSKHLKWGFKPLAGGVPGQEQFYVRVERNHVAPDTSLIVEVSPNLVDWYGEGDGWVTQTLDSAGSLEFQATTVSLEASRLFFRFVLSVVGE